MFEHNPYAPPEAPVADVVPLSRGCRREKKYVVVPQGADLPPRCIVCNAPVRTRIKTRKMYWHSQWLYLLLFLGGPILMAVVALAVRKTAHVSPGFCAAHMRARRNKLGSLFGLGLLLLMLGLALLPTEQTPLAVGALVVAVLLVIAGCLASKILVAREITDTQAKYSGCGEPFLRGLSRAD